MALADQTLNDEAAEALFRTLVAYDFIDEHEKQQILYMERTKGVTFSAQDIIDSYMDEDTQFQMRKSQIEEFNTIVEEHGLNPVVPEEVPVEAEEEAGPWYRDPKQLAITAAVGPSAVAWRLGQAAGIDLGEISNIGRWGAEVMSGGADALASSKFNAAARKRIIQDLESMGIDVDRADILGDKYGNYSELRAVLRDKYDLSDADIANITNDGIAFGLEAWNQHKGLQDKIDEINAEEAELIGDDEALKRRRAFEVLNADKPGKYDWNSETKTIHETVGGNAVDNYGKVIDLMDPEGVWEEVVGTAPWLGLGLGDEAQADAMGNWLEESGAEEQYWEMYDVISEPERYGAEANRYLPGGRGFLGNFGSDYSVTYEDGAAVGRVVEDWRAGAMPNLRPTNLHGPQIADAFYDSSADFVARPFYESNDNWALFAGMSKEYIIEVQNKLVEVGALAAGDVVQGSWGPAEAKVMDAWLETANGQARRWEDVNMDTVKSIYATQARSMAAPARRPFVARTYRSMDPATMEQSVQSVMRQMLGRDATSNEIADLGGFLSEQHRGAFVADTQAARQEYNAEGRAITSGTEQGGGEVKNIDFEARFVQQFEQSNAAEIGRGKRTELSSDRQQVVGGALNNLMNRLGGGF